MHLQIYSSEENAIVREDEASEKFHSGWWFHRTFAGDESTQVSYFFPNHHITIKNVMLTMIFILLKLRLASIVYTKIIFFHISFLH